MKRASPPAITPPATAPPAASPPATSPPAASPPAAAAVASSASSTSSDERRRESACRALVADSPPPRPKRERSTRFSKPPRAPSPATRMSLPSSPARAVRGKVARLLDSYLDRTIGAAADDDDHPDPDPEDGPRAASSVASTEPEAEHADEVFRLFADSKPGAVKVKPEGGASKKRRVEEKKPVDLSDSDSEEEKEHVKRLQSVVVDIKPPEAT